MKILVCGTREWIEQRPIEDVLRLLPKDALVIQGGARGADNIAGFVAKNVLGMKVRAYPVDNKLDGPWPAAGVRRNMRMLASENPHEGDGTSVDFGLAFTLTQELTRGTAHMVETMTLGEIPVVTIFYKKSSWAKSLESFKKEIEDLC